MSALNQKYKKPRLQQAETAGAVAPAAPATPEAPETPATPAKYAATAESSVLDAALSDADSALGESYAACGRLAATMGLHQLAVVNLAKSMQKLPRDVGVLVDFAKALGAKANQESIVVSTLADAVQRSPELSDPRVWLQLASSYYHLLKPDEAFHSVSRAIAAQEIQGIKDAGTWALQARILLLWMDSDAKMTLETLTPYFIGAIEMAIAAGDTQLELQSRVSLAQLYHRFACYPESQAEVSRAFVLVRSDPSSGMPRPSTVNTLCYLYNFLGIIQFKMNYKASAYSVIQEAMSALPQVSATARLLATLAQFYMIDENLPQLRAILPALLVEKTALTEKELIRLYLMNWLLGRVYDMLDDTKQSYHFYQQAVNCKPQSASLWVGIGSLYLRMRQFEDAHIAFSHALNYASKLENFEQPFFLRFNRLFAAFAWVGLSQVFVATFQKQSALDALRQASVLFTAEGDLVHSSQVDQLYNDVLATPPQNPMYVIMNVPPQILLELFLYYDTGVFANQTEGNFPKISSCEPVAHIMPLYDHQASPVATLPHGPAVTPSVPPPPPQQVYNDLATRPALSQQHPSTVFLAYPQPAVTVPATSALNIKPIAKNMPGVNYGFPAQPYQNPPVP
ncbi:KLTH0C04950p [Lachancea thermotolerans CBS 6340]|uniref:KLTH0C04950p n=1 Tax=Lachancea thermotolerans (strain ATCC 56472 / CBS 6340 / NRRL Y-8284) TaxID=559295 RepID=C5DDZ1_LACTC|nr:KLTH0C04950p [Lachancea thermotolerans CBS 6340]CAR22002.1 KLTH0C04950p [Lachancea thermotolerans CBS 6340]